MIEPRLGDEPRVTASFTSQMTRRPNLVPVLPMEDVPIAPLARDLSHRGKFVTGSK